MSKVYSDILETVVQGDRKLMPLDCNLLLLARLNVPTLLIPDDLLTKLKIQRKVSSIKSKLKKEDGTRQEGEVCNTNVSKEIALSLILLYIPPNRGGI